MGKMKELFMQQQEMIDMEREYLTDDVLAQEEDYLRYKALQQEEEMNILKTKIEVAHGTTIEVNTKEPQTHRELAFS